MTGEQVADGAGSPGPLDRLRAGYDGSATLAAVAAVARRGRSVSRTASRWIRGSWLFRWLTAEPDPEVIVIDLRETYTIGPFVRLLDRIAPAVGAVVRGSITWRIAARVARAAERRVEESPVLRRVAAALAPPEPPDGQGDLDRQRKPDRRSERDRARDRDGNEE